MIGGGIVIVSGADSTTGGIVIAIGGVDTTIGDGVVIVGGSNVAIGATDCVPWPPVTPRSAVLLKVLEVVEEEEVLLVVSRRAFLAACSASLEER